MRRRAPAAALFRRGRLVYRDIQDARRTGGEISLEVGGLIETRADAVIPKREKTGSGDVKEPGPRGLRPMSVKALPGAS